MTEKREELELKKIELEIKELGRPFWKKSGFLVPFFAALISVALGHYSGWFDVQTKQLEIKRASLNDDIKSFQKEKVSLIDSNKSLKANNDLLKEEKTSLTDSIESLKANNDLLKKSNALLIVEQEVLLDQVNLAKKLRTAQASYVSTEVLRFKELVRSGELPDCGGYDVFFEAIEDRFFNLEDADIEAELELIEFEANNEENTSAREQKLIEYMNKRGMLDDDGCFEDHNGETHCTNF